MSTHSAYLSPVHVKDEPPQLPILDDLSPLVEEALAVAWLLHTSFGVEGGGGQARTVCLLGKFLGKSSTHGTMAVSV